MSRRHKRVTTETQTNEESMDSSKATVDLNLVVANALSETLASGLITNNASVKGRKDNKVCKIFSLDSDGNLKKTPSAAIYKGRARAIRFEFSSFGDVLEDLNSSQTITLGVPHYDEKEGGEIVEDSVPLLTAAKVESSGKLAISRTKSYFKMLEGKPGLALVDVDELPSNIKTQDAVMVFFYSFCPELEGCAAWLVISSSSFIKKGGKYINELNGVHVYFALKNGTDLKEFVSWAHKRSVLHGENKKIVDPSVGSSERLIFENKPELLDGLEKDNVPPKYFDGGLVDFESFPILTAEEEAKYAQLTGKKQSTKVSSSDTGVIQEKPVFYSTKGAKDPHDVLESVFRPALVRSALHFIDPDEDYNIWIQMGMVLSVLTQGSSYGLRMFKEWSRDNGDSTKYQEGECEQKWDSFHGNYEDGVGLGTLFSIAKGNGWDGGYFASPNVARYVEDESFAVLYVFSELYIYVMIGGKPVIVYKVEDRLKSNGVMVPFLRTEFSLPKSIQDWENQIWIPIVVYETGGDGLGIKKIEKQSAYQTWFRSKWRNQRVGVQMSPFNTTGMQSIKPLINEGFYNFFNGLAFEPKAGSWGLIRKHIFEIICDGRKEVFDYLMNLWTFMFQKPNERSGIIVVMVSESGTGKNVIMQPIVDALRPHSCMADSPDRIVGQFNDHLAQVICLVANEAVFGAKYNDALKTIVTEPTLIVERKGIPIVEVNNCINLTILTNNKKAVPLDLFDRRMFFVDVSNKYSDKRLASVEYKATRTAYFDPLVDEIKNGGREAFIEHLVNRDISSFKPSNMPAIASESRIESKSMRLNSVHKWWLNCLEESMVVIKEGSGAYADLLRSSSVDWEEGCIDIPRKSGCGLFDSYLSSCKEQGLKPNDKSSFGKQLESFGIESSGNKKIDGERYYTVPKLSVARDIFANGVFHEATESLFPIVDEDPVDLKYMTGPLAEVLKRKKG